MNPEEVLAGIEAFTTARIADKLAGGPASDSYLIKRGAEQFVLRVDTDVAAALGLDRFAEAKILAYLSQNGLAPKPEFVAPERGILIAQYIEGRAWSEADLHDAGKIKKLAALLRRLHALKPVGQPFNLHARISNYARIIGTTDGRKLADDTQRILCELEAQSEIQCLCHNDLVCTNIIEGPGLVDGKGLALIDWEYAAIGDPFFDLAIIAEQHRFDRGEVSGLLQAYFGEAREKNSLRLARCRALYASLKLLWIASVDKLQGVSG